MIGAFFSLEKKKLKFMSFHELGIPLKTLELLLQLRQQGAICLTEAHEKKEIHCCLYHPALFLEE